MDVTEIKPKPEHFKDPYVIQLIGAIALLEDRIEDLEEGGCRFNCRKSSEAFMAGARWMEYGDNPETAYKEWKHGNKETTGE